MKKVRKIIILCGVLIGIFWLGGCAIDSLSTSTVTESFQKCGEDNLKIESSLDVYQTYISDNCQLKHVGVFYTYDDAGKETLKNYKKTDSLTEDNLIEELEESNIYFAETVNDLPDCKDIKADSENDIYNFTTYIPLNSLSGISQGDVICYRSVVIGDNDGLKYEMSEAGEFTITKTPSYHMSDLEFVKEKAATYEEAGNVAYYYCKDCNKYYKDAEGNMEITEEDVIIPRLVNTNQPEDEDKDEVGSIDKKPSVATKDKETEKTTKNTKAKTNTISEENPETGDTSNMELWIALISVAALCSAIKIRKKN